MLLFVPSIVSVSTVFCLSLWLGVIPVFVSSRHQIAVARSPGHRGPSALSPSVTSYNRDQGLQGWEFWTKRPLMSDKDLCLMQLVTVSSVQAELCQVISVPQTQTPEAFK